MGLARAGAADVFCSARAAVLLPARRWLRGSPCPTLLAHRWRALRLSAAGATRRAICVALCLGLANGETGRKTNVKPKLTASLREPRAKGIGAGSALRPGTRRAPCDVTPAARAGPVVSSDSFLSQAFAVSGHREARPTARCVSTGPVLWAQPGARLGSRLVRLAESRVQTGSQASGAMTPGAPVPACSQILKRSLGRASLSLTSGAQERPPGQTPASACAARRP